MVREEVEDKSAPMGGRKSPLAPKEKSDSVQSITRAVAILKVIAAGRDGMTLTEIARATNLASSTVHRLLATLQQEQFVQFRSEGSRWQVGRDAFTVGSAFSAVGELGKAARPYLRRLAEKSGETANLAILNNDMAVYLEQVESPLTLGALCKPGGRVVLHCTSLGKSMLAAMQPHEVCRILTEKGMTRFTRNTVDTPSRLAFNLSDVRASGYAVDNEEHTLGLRCVAAAVLNQNSEPIGAISISGPTRSVSRERLPQLGSLVRSIAEELTLAFGANIHHRFSRPIRLRPI